MPGRAARSFGEAQQLQRGAIGKKRDRRKVASQDAEQIELAMRQIVDSVAIQIELETVAPKIADAVDRPATAGNVGAAGFDRMKVARENVFGELVVVGIRTEAQADVILGNAVADDVVFVALIEGKADRISGDLVLLRAGCDRTIER